MSRIVAALLIFFEPLRFGVEALTVIPTISYRGPLAMLELVVHGLVAALSAAAGFGLFNNSPDGPRLGRVAIVAVTARAIQSMTWSVLPNNTPPGSELLSAGVTIAIAVVALIILRPRAVTGGQ